MDNLTHTLTGLMLSRAGLNRVTPYATPILLLAANVPDIDIVTLAWGQDFYFHHHRGITHAFVMVPVMALLPLLVVRLLARKPLRWMGAFAAAAGGVLSHLALDYLNHYGVRVLLPWSGEFLSLGVTFVADAWIWLLLISGWAWPALSRLVSSEIGAKPGTGRGMAWFVLTCMLMYNAARVVPWQRALAVQEGRLYDGAAPRRIAAIPHPVNPLRWVGIVDAGAFYQVTDINLLFEFDPAVGQRFPKSEAHWAIDAAKRTQPFQDLLNFTSFGLWRVTPGAEGQTKVELMDLRFGTPPAPRFYSTAIVDATGRVLEARFQH